MGRPALLLGLALCGGAARAADVWPVYVNVLHRYHVCYPAALLMAQGEADNSAGQAFKATDGAELAVWGDYSGDGKTLSQALEDQASASAGSRGRITYRASGKTWAVASGEDGAGRIFYVKLFKRGDHVATALLRYPQAKAERYRAVTERISRCFGPAPGF